VNSGKTLAIALEHMKPTCQRIANLLVNYVKIVRIRTVDVNPGKTLAIALEHMKPTCQRIANLLVNYVKNFLSL